MEKMENPFRKDPLLAFAVEFMIGSIYELFREMYDFSEVKSLKNHKQIRDFYDYPDLFDKEPLILRDKANSSDFKERWIYLNELLKILAQKVVLLCINISHIFSAPWHK